VISVAHPIMVRGFARVRRGEWEPASDLRPRTVLGSGVARGCNLCLVVRSGRVVLLGGGMTRRERRQPTRAEWAAITSLRPEVRRILAKTAKLEKKPPGEDTNTSEGETR
jgi:hypothetical protein